jgi:hypothetical protein
MLRHFLRSLLLSGALAITPAAHAGIIFSDSFTSFTSSDPPLPVGWTIENGGSINILGTCGGYSFETIPDFQTGADNCFIDLDGNVPPFDEPNPIQPGLLTKQLDLIATHIYKASFDLAGNQVNPFSDRVYVNFGTTSEDFLIGGYDDFTAFEVFFTPSTSGPYLLSFQNSNIDAFGALLDNVVVTDTSVPAPLPLLGAGAAFSYHRRLRLLRHKLHGRRQ